MPQDKPKKQKDTRVTRFNAVQHGLLAVGLTELDRGDYDAFSQTLMENLSPQGVVEKFLVERICLYMIRLQRATRLEAEFITAELYPPKTEQQGIDMSLDLDDLCKPKTVVVDQGKPARLPVEAVGQLGCTFQRYETSIENKLYRAFNELERRQRLRKGEKIPAPVSVDVGVHTKEEVSSSFGNLPSMIAVSES